MNASEPLSGFLFERERASPWRWLFTLGFAATAHLAVFALAGTAPARAAQRASPLEMEFLSVPTPVTPAPPPPPPLRRAGAVARRAVAPVRAPPVLTASPQASTPATEPPVVSGDSETYTGGPTAVDATSEAPAEAGPPAPRVDAVAVTRAYLGRIREALGTGHHYPLAAQREGIQGAVVVAFVIGADGRFRRVRVEVSSGSDLLDRAAIEAVEALSGRLARPTEAGALELPLRTTLRYELAP